MPGKESPKLEEDVLKIIDSAGEGISFGGILEELEDPDVVTSSIRKILVKLESENKILSFPENATREGRPKNLYKSIKQNGLVSTSTRSVLSEETEIREQETLLDSIIKDSVGLNALPPEKRDEIYIEAAELLLKEKPIELLLRYAEWLKLQHAETISQYYKADNLHARHEVEDTLKVIEDIAIHVFHRMLGVPVEGERDAEGRVEPPPFRLMMNGRTKEDDSCLNIDELRKYLSFSIMGKTVLEVMECTKVDPPLHIGGTDASTQTIKLSNVLPWQMQQRDLAIITAIGIRYDIFKRSKETDINPDPKSLAQLSRQAAINEGLLIPPQLYEEEMQSRIREAAMDLRQYIKDNEIMFLNSNVSIHFRDGRIFPLEHRFFDAINYGFHGEIVRKSLRAFSYIVNQVGSDEGKTLFCGFVKRPGLDLIASLVVWYIGFGSAEARSGLPIHPMKLRDYLRMPERVDHNEIVNRLFAALKDKMTKNSSIVTFRVARRFQSLAEPKIANMSPTTDRETWEKRLMDYGSNICEYEGSHEGRIRDFVSLCARAAILAFYTSKPGMMDPSFETDVVIPRIEILVPYVNLLYDGPDSPLTKNEMQYVRHVISVISHERVLDMYPDKLFPFSDSNLIFLAPLPVIDAHECSKAIAKEYADDFMELLAREAKIFWANYRAKKSS